MSVLAGSANWASPLASLPPQTFCGPAARGGRRGSVLRLAVAPQRFCGPAGSGPQMFCGPAGCGAQGFCAPAARGASRDSVVRLAAAPQPSLIWFRDRCRLESELQLALHQIGSAVTISETGSGNATALIC